MTEINWNIDKVDANRISEIVRRARAMAEDHGPEHIDPVDHMALSMDITACHANGCPLDLERLAEADDATFGHDVFGIRKHIDRETGQLTNCFVPRCAVREPQHTPGPWHVDEINTPNGRSLQVNAFVPGAVDDEGCDDWVEIADIHEFTDGQDMANARLIAAAPKLREHGQALRDFIQIMMEEGRINWKNDDAPIVHSMLECWDDAIAKARIGDPNA